MIIFKKGDTIQLSDNLWLYEIDCKCLYMSCTATFISKELIKRFERLRRICGNHPIYINSALRCSVKNKESAGADLSRHLMGIALDLRKPEQMKYSDFYGNCLEVFAFVLPYKEYDFIHCDLDKR